MKNNLRVIMIGFICSLYACTSDTNSRSTTKWEWIKTYGSIAGQTWTPETTHTTKSMELSEDVITFYERGLEVEQYDYIIFESDSILGGDIPYKFISYDDNTRLFSEQGDTLVVRDLCSDCYDDYYVKK